MAASNFNATWDAVALNQAIKIADKKTITNILCKRSLSQRLAIVEAYKASFKKDIIKDIKSKVSGKVKGIYVNLLMSTPELYCRHLKKSKNDDFFENVTLAVIASSADFLDSDSGDDNVLIEFLCTSSNAEIRKLCATYQQLFSKRLEHGIREDKSGSVKKMLSSLAAAKRNECFAPDLKAAADDAEALKSFFKNNKHDETPVIEMMCSRSFAQIRLISVEYKKLTRKSLVKSVKKNMIGPVKVALIAIIRTANNRNEYYARLINKAINNYLLEDRTLGRVIVARSEVDLMNIKEEFHRLFRMPIKSFLKDEIRGSYKHALFALLGES